MNQLAKQVVDLATMDEAGRAEVQRRGQKADAAPLHAKAIRKGQSPGRRGVDMREGAMTDGVATMCEAKAGKRPSAAKMPVPQPDAPPPTLPEEDNTSEGLAALLLANEHYRHVPWPAPYDLTRHHVRVGDARDMSWVNDGSVDLVVTSPPYWTLKKYEDHEAQLGSVEDYEAFLRELDKVWAHCKRVLVDGGRVCCVVGDVCIPRRKGRHHVMPLHADIMPRARRIGLDCVTGIIWHKIANGVTEAEGNGAGFYGKPYQPNAIIKNDVEYILFMRKPGAYRSVPPIKKALSMLTRAEMQAWFRSIWGDIKGASTRDGHPAPYPVGIAERLIRMFSFAGDTVLDPFLGTGSTSLAAAAAGRNSIGVEIDPRYLTIAIQRLRALERSPRMFGASRAVVEVGDDGASTESRHGRGINANGAGGEEAHADRTSSD